MADDALLADAVREHVKALQQAIDKACFAGLDVKMSVDRAPARLGDRTEKPLLSVEVFRRV